MHASQLVEHADADDVRRCAHRRRYAADERRIRNGQKQAGFLPARIYPLYLRAQAVQNAQQDGIYHGRGGAVADPHG